ncbi:hypothetical protein GRJ2_002054800 [Grus japonensis]|uniref:Uncharacterized protein n=1 Tax=Grus japonensis TaxID=30415 RepID=A0ABC9XE26_GRUJA
MPDTIRANVIWIPAFQELTLWNVPAVLTQLLVVLGIVLTHVQDLALGLAELHAVRMGPPLKPVKVPLDGIPSLQHVDHTTQLGVVSKLAEGALDPTVHVTDKDVKQCWSQYRPLRNATRHRSPLGR